MDESDAGAWGTDWHPVRFVGVNDDGFPLNVGYPDEADDNVDVLLTVDTTRYAELTWEDTTPDPVLNLPFTADEYHVGCFDSGRYTMLSLGANGMWSFLDIVE